MKTEDDRKSSNFKQEMRGYFTGILQWSDLDNLWIKVIERSEQEWYLFTVNDSAPLHASSELNLKKHIDWLDIELRETHKERYCGIVYVDNITKPSFIKIYDPKNLGTSCSCSAEQPLPKWILSIARPVNLVERSNDISKGIHWWNRLSFSS